MPSCKTNLQVLTELSAFEYQILSPTRCPPARPWDPREANSHRTGIRMFASSACQISTSCSRPIQEMSLAWETLGFGEVGL